MSMTRYFFKDLGFIPEPIEARRPINWCLFISNSSKEEGVFFSQLSPGIMDCPNGVLYIAPERSMPEIKISNLSTDLAKRCILKFYFDRL